MLAALMPSNRLVMRVILHTGLRISDVLALRPDDLRPHRWITEQKTGKRRFVGFPADLLDDLRKECGKYWVFPGRNPTKHRTRQAVWCDVKRAAAAFRLPQNVGTHSARKVYAVDLMRKYGDIAHVQRILQHSSPTVTAILCYGRRAFGAKIPEKARQGLTAPALRGMMQQKGVAVWYRSGQRPHTGFTGQRQQNVYFVAVRVRRGYWADCSP